MKTEQTISVFTIHILTSLSINCSVHEMPENTEKNANYNFPESQVSLEIVCSV